MRATAPLGAVELWGTFEVDNFGDQLFPIVHAAMAKSLGVGMTTLASPVGGPLPGWEGVDSRLGPPADTARPIVPVDVVGFLDQVEGIDAVLVAGGDVVQRGDVSLLFPDGSRRPYPLGVVGRDVLVLGAELPVAWHSVGLPQALEDVLGDLALAGNLAVGSVRESESQGRLERAVGRLLPIRSDSVWALPCVWSPEVLNDAFGRLLAAGRVPESGYVIAHASFLDPDGEALFVEQLAMAVRECDVLLVPLGPCHGDDEMVRRLSTASGCLAAERFSVLDRAAVLAGARGYVGTAFHGGVVAASYGTPTAWIRNVPKTRRAASQLDRGLSRSFTLGEVSRAVSALLDGSLDISRSRVRQLRHQAWGHARLTWTELSEAGR